MNKLKPEFQPASRYPIEFVSPYSLEECVTRLPKEMVEQITHEKYEFRLRKDLEGQISRFMDVKAYITRRRENTVIEGEVRIQEAFYAIGIFLVPFGGLIFGTILKSFLLGFLISVSNSVFGIRWAHQTRNSLKNSVFALFRPIPKGQERFWNLLWPIRSYQHTTPIALSFCAVRLQRLVFQSCLIEIFALNEQEYQFKVDSLKFGVRSVGHLYLEGKEGTIVNYRVGFSPIFYLTCIPFFAFMILALFINSDTGALGILPLVIVLFPLLWGTIGYSNLIALKNTIRDAAFPFKVKE